jgi:hypothetical protein
VDLVEHLLVTHALADNAQHAKRLIGKAIGDKEIGEIEPRRIARPAIAASGGGFKLVPLLIESNAFKDGGIVPDKYSFRGGNVQPDFKISNAPAETQSFAIILHDIDVALGGPDDVLH